MTSHRSFHRKDGRRLKLGVVANEFFDAGYSRMGGFGWATRQLSRCFGGDPELGVDVVLIDAERGRSGTPSRATLHGVPLIARANGDDAFVRRLRDERFDLLLSIDYRRSYRKVFSVLPRVPILVWSRDPRAPEDAERIRSVRLPGAEGVVPAGLDVPDATSLAHLASRRRWGRRRRVVFGTPSLSLRERAAAAYALPGLELALLPNIVDLDPGAVKKSEHPSVVFLARLDSTKRPWLFVELARHFPDAAFLLLGQSHLRDTDVAWRPAELPRNVRALGHVDGEEKLRILAEAWVLVNTSIHEGLAVSFLEALACETPLLSCVDAERVASRFGTCVGRHDGSGMDAIPALVAALRALLADPSRRARLGREGRSWVNEVHSRERFLESFRALCIRAGALE